MLASPVAFIIVVTLRNLFAAATQFEEEPTSTLLTCPVGRFVVVFAVFNGLPTTSELEEVSSMTTLARVVIITVLVTIRHFHSTALVS